MTTKKSPLEFPCDFPLKIIGKTTTDFENTVKDILQKHVPAFSEEMLSFRPSGKSNYTSISIKIVATSQQQLDLIYSELSRSTHVMMVL